MIDGPRLVAAFDQEQARCNALISALISAVREDGWGQGDIESSTTMIAEMVREFLHHSDHDAEMALVNVTSVLSFAVKRLSRLEQT